jgi:ribosomal protein L11 methyltransferase
MLKFSAKILSEENANLVNEFLNENELVRWVIEKEISKERYFLRGYVDGEAEGKAEFKRISEACKGVGEVTILQVKPKDWAEAYKKSAEPWKYERLHWIPTFMKGKVETDGDEIPIYIEPGMAFGTGSHETTRLCGRVLMMFKSLFEKTDDLIIKSCLDVGCGSGILGISAIKLGLIHATLIDIDVDAIRISRENAELNGVFPDQIDFVEGDLKIGLLGRQADLLMANISADVLIANGDLIVNSVKPDGLMCLGGILIEEKAKLSAVFSELTKKRWGSGVLENSIDEGDWTVLIYFRG